MRIIHFSDLHGQMYDLPEADMYICTGDLLQNYPDIITVKNTNGMFGGGYTRFINHDKEERLQNDWFKKKFKKKGRTLRHFLGSPDAPVLVVRGNHDFIDLGPLFGGEVYEISSESCHSYNVLGLDIGGFRGINYIVGEWSDEKRSKELYKVVNAMPKSLDIVVTHSPPYNILDGKFRERYGIVEFASWINKKMCNEEKLPKLFCFGHIHNDYGVLTWEDGTIFSNAATTHNIIDLQVDTI